MGSSVGKNVECEVVGGVTNGLNEFVAKGVCGSMLANTAGDEAELVDEADDVDEELVDWRPGELENNLKKSCCCC